MDESELTLDGNAAAGLLHEIFAWEMTTARGTCASCGAVGEIGTLTLYIHAPGAVIRCPVCTAVLLRVVRSNGRAWLDARGISCLEFRLDDG